MIVYRYAIHMIYNFPFLGTPSMHLHPDSLIIDHNIDP